MAKLQRYSAKRKRLLDEPNPRERLGPRQPYPLSDTTLSTTPKAAGLSRKDESEAIDVPQEDVRQNCNDLVCFGMIPSIDARCGQSNILADSFPIHLDASDRFHSTDASGCVGYILQQHGQLIAGLLREKTLMLHASCTLDPTSKPRTSHPSFTQVQCTLDITVYGPFYLFDEIGEWLDEYGIYLQDPRVCHLDVKYCNPQKLSCFGLDSSPLVSQAITQSLATVHFQELVERPDPLEIISGQEDLAESSPPAIIRTILHKHQKQALTFMLRREKGWTTGDTWQDIWETLDATHGTCYINRITNQPQDEAPLQCRGGIIADPMGLGKTLTMIALVANDIARKDTNRNYWHDPGMKHPVAATLIIVPQPLINIWEDQLTSHVAKGGIRYCCHHGKNRLVTLTSLNSVNIVLTTYHTLSADWKAFQGNPDGHLIFSVRWKRIILDEAHLIRNIKTRMARAICELEADSRWAVTGTPIQNHLSDIAALLKFIRASPYDDHKRFEADISHLWKAGADEEAVKRLKLLAGCLILRRAKQTINLLPPHHVKCAVDFNKAERALYDSIRQQTIMKIEDALTHSTEVSRLGAYVNVLQQIESMRLACNLGLYYYTRHDKAPGSTDWAVTAQKAFNIQREMNTINCLQCYSTLEVSESLSEDILPQDSPLFSRCMKYACVECSHELRINGYKMTCGHTPRCPIAPVSVSNNILEETFSQVSSRKKGDTASLNSLPSKVEMLISDLKGLPLDIKSIVFSTWRLTLDIVEAGLNQAGIQCVRFDGKVPQARRQPILNRFRSDPNVRVMLLTLQCGAVGLNLTEASRAYLMEPHWNPTIEEQALARIHRIGQTREVTTVRFYIRNSFEERVMEVQESKKNLASVLLSGHDGGQADDSLGALQRLRSLL